jgi:hypothetical protein
MIDPDDVFECHAVVSREKAQPSLSGLIGVLQGERPSLATALLKWNVRLIENPVIAQILSGLGFSPLLLAHLKALTYRP